MPSSVKLKKKKCWKAILSSYTISPNLDFVVVDFLGGISLCSSDCAGTCYVEQTDLKLPELPTCLCLASAGITGVYLAFKFWLLSNGFESYVLSFCEVGSFVSSAMVGVVWNSENNFSRVGTSLPPCRPQGLNSVHQAWWLVLYLVCPFHQYV